MPRATHPVRVLIVDDNHDARATLGTLVQMAGYDVHGAADGAMALQLAAHLRPDVILMDLGMPRMDGLEAAREIRRRPWGRNVFLVAVTGWGLAEDRKRSREAGFDQHLVKPVGVAQLLRILEEAGRRSQGD